MNPKVTVILPTLNMKAYIHQSLESVLNQTLKDIEVFVVDAASTDGTREIVREYMAKDPRVSLLDDIKKSTGYAKNIGIERASASYIAIVEPDDYIELDMMEKLYQTAEETGVDFIKANYSAFLGEGDSRFDFYKSTSAFSGDYGRIINPQKDNHCFGWMMYEWLGLYRKSFLDKYHIRHNESPGAAYQDHGFWFLTFAYARSIYLLPYTFYHYRCDNPNASIKNPNNVFNICKEYGYMQRQLELQNDVWNRVVPAYYRGYFYDNCVLYTKLADQWRLPLLQEMRETLVTAKAQGGLDRNLYSDDEWEDLSLLLRGEEEFYKRKEKLFSDSKKRLETLKEELSGSRQIVIYGAGSNGCNLHYLLEEHRIVVAAYVDGNCEKWGKMQNGIPILSWQDCETKFAEAVYLIAVKNHSDEIEKMLIDNHIPENRIRKCDIAKFFPNMI